MSRQLLKKFAAEKYKLAPTAANIAHLNHAITHGAEKGIFLLPKGLSYIRRVVSIAADVVP